MVRETIQIGHPALKATNAVITDFSSDILKQLVADLKETMYHNGLIGIAAPQIAENFRVFVTEPRETVARPADQADEFRVYINPAIVYESEDQSLIWEACGSVLNAGLFGPVLRPKTITIEAFDLVGNKFRFTADGILGRVIQHEYDHLHGVEFTEKIYDYKQIMTLEFYLERVKNNLEHKEAQKITIKQFEKVSL